MYNFLIFGGTSEGRELFDHCKSVGMKCTISVASDYGAELLSEGANQKIILTQFTPSASNQTLPVSMFPSEMGKALSIRKKSAEKCFCCLTSLSWMT